MKEQNIVVSVIVPCYNCEKTVEDTLKALEKQEFKDFEVVCVNDGSTDCTADILARWKEKKSINISIISQENRGVSRARNNGVKNAKGKYIVFCDADDMYNEYYLQALVFAMECEKGDIAYCRLSRKKEEVTVTKLQNLVYVLENSKQAMNKLIYEMGDFGFYCYIFKKELIETEKIYFDENTSFGEDREFIWKYLSLCEKIFFIDLKLYWYRVNENSVTKSLAKWNRTGILDGIERTYAFFDKNKYEYKDEFFSYMYPRCIWSVAKDFSRDGQKELFFRLIRTYDVRDCMKKNRKNKSKLVAISSYIFLIHPTLFYFAIKTYSRIR